MCLLCMLVCPFSGSDAIYSFYSIPFPSKICPVLFLSIYLFLLSLYFLSGRKSFCLVNVQSGSNLFRSHCQYLLFSPFQQLPQKPVFSRQFLSLSINSSLYLSLRSIYIPVSLVSLPSMVQAAIFPRAGRGVHPLKSGGGEALNQSLPERTEALCSHVRHPFLLQFSAKFRRNLVVNNSGSGIYFTVFSVLCLSIQSEPK